MEAGEQSETTDQTKPQPQPTETQDETVNPEEIKIELPPQSEGPPVIPEAEVSKDEPEEKHELENE